MKSSMSRNDTQGRDYIPTYTGSAESLVFRAGRRDAAASQTAGLRVEALLASWPFACLSGRQGSFGPSQKNKEIKHDSMGTLRDDYPICEIPSRFLRHGTGYDQ
ncbi:hypothetical protein SYJ56_22935 [Algoriphagus sp. D3-2-R+10]|uniref:hypothetical protein n=1 Tax=Algoriphagus aurantiacus TaxID=3103948 RepID=UPI002B36A3E2|nr:hypothetical protein [Algoriphagus sp. D3-2-R+10]MEB2778184.1 hypothetical protein [Algoriphagus sp. D3-2-R+10]